MLSVMLKFSFRNGICLIGIYCNDIKIISILQHHHFFLFVFLVCCYIVLNQLNENLEDNQFVFFSNDSLAFFISIVEILVKFIIFLYVFKLCFIFQLKRKTL